MSTPIWLMIALRLIWDSRTYMFKLLAIHMQALCLIYHLDLMTSISLGVMNNLLVKLEVCKSKRSPVIYQISFTSDRWDDQQTDMCKVRIPLFFKWGHNNVNEAIERLTDFVNYAYLAFFSLFHGQYLLVLAITFVRDIKGGKNPSS